MKKKESRWQMLYHQDDRTPAKAFSREDAIDRPRSAESIYVGVDGKDFTVWKRHYRLTVLGPSVFWKQTACASLTYKKGKFYGSLAPVKDDLCKAFKLDWITTNRWVNRLLSDKRDLWKLIIDGKITNPEMLLKTVSKRYFKGAYSYKNLKKWCTGECIPVSLWSLYYHTTNPNLAIEVLASSKDRHEFYSLFDDTLKYAEYLNEKINPKWSILRMRAEHQRQIEQRELRKLEGLPSDNIAPAFSKDGLSLILNERECYLEGCSMHNCVHRCYWDEISQGYYLIARGTINGEYLNLGIRCFQEVAFNQVHTIYNGGVSSATRDKCLQWIADNEKELKETVAYIRKQRVKSINNYCNERHFVDDHDEILPF